MRPVNGSRRRIWRVTLSALAGGGLTAAGLGGPLGAAALGAETPVTTEGSTTPATPTTPAATPESATTTQPATTTATTPAPTGAPTSTSTTTTIPVPPAPEAPTVVLQRKQKATAAKPKPSGAGSGKSHNTTKKAAETAGANNVAESPQAVASQAALEAALASSAASVQALDFYRIPLFLLPIYKAAAVQYGVPWQILAAINEIETDYGNDQSVSTAGAVGWMQFMPATWLQYGVDALNAGYADPYNPVDAVFAAARYLRAAGAATDLNAAILAYNHSQEYLSSVLLRAKLISTYPQAVIATLTGLIDGRLPVTGKQVSWSLAPTSPSSATANAALVGGGAPGTSGTPAPAAPAGSAPGSSAPPAPAAAAAAATAKSSLASREMRFDEVLSAPNAAVVAVQDGRIVGLGDSQRLGKYVVLRDVYGDVFTYAGLGNIAPYFTLPKAPSTPATSPLVEIASTQDPAPSLPASAGSQPPLTLQVKAAKAPKPHTAVSAVQAVEQAESQEAAASGAGKVRLFAHPGNPDALAAAAVAATRKPHNSAPGRLPLRKGSVVASGTVLGHVSMPSGAVDGHLRFAVQPAGDPATVDPGAILANWAQLDAALHPRGAKAQNPLLGATAGDVLLMSKAQLERAVLSDPDITIYACGRQDIASGKIDKRVLAVLAFLSRSGLKPKVSALSCGQARHGANGSPSASSAGDAVDISAINGTAIAGHQGAGTVTDLTIRTLLSLPGEFLPHEIVSLMRYPGAPNTHAVAAYSARIHLDFPPRGAAVALSPAAAASVAHSARSGHAAPPPVVSTTDLSGIQWDQLFTQIAGLPAPKVASKPTSAAIRDPKHR
ncbi:MAG TPA: lytic murein transglycosylase [Solirubrobacteraceae bacterium]|nr:lytic murein transglycosylase [Solirubrobacteraceae bacterium]